MSNAISKFQFNRQPVDSTKGAPYLDPEIAAVYAESVPGKSESGTDANNRGGQKTAEKTPELLNQFERLAAIAEENQRTGVDRKAYADGSFDQVEHDVSNVFKIGFRLLTSD